MEHTPPPLFERGPAPVVRLVFFVISAVLLMILDARFQYAEAVRQGFAWVAYPMQRAATAPILVFERASDFFESQGALRAENAALREEKLHAAKDLLRLQSLEAENERLRQLLQSRQRAGLSAVYAEIVYQGRDPFSRKVIIDKGSQNGVELGQPVIDAAGVVGQVTRVHPLLAEVTLVLDKDQAVPVQILRNSLRGVAFGSGDGSTIEMRFMAANADIEIGDLLVTSGLDGVYPAGLPVAKVTRIDKDNTYAFARVICAPAGGAAQSRQLLVLSRADPLPSYPKEEPLAPKRGTRGAKKGRS